MSARFYKFETTKHDKSISTSTQAFSMATVANASSTKHHSHVDLLVSFLHSLASDHWTSFAWNVRNLYLQTQTSPALKKYPIPSVLKSWWRWTFEVVSQPASLGSVSVFWGIYHTHTCIIMCLYIDIWMFPKIRGKPPQKWMVYFMEHPMNKWDGFGGSFPTIFGNIHINIWPHGWYFTHLEFLQIGGDLDLLKNPRFWGLKTRARSL